MDRSMIDRFTNRGSRNITKSFSPYDSDGGESELSQAMKAAHLIREREKQKAAADGQATQQQLERPSRHLIEKANEAKAKVEHSQPKPQQPKQEERAKDTSETDEQIRKKLEFARKANIAAAGISSEASTEEILNAALKDLF